MIVVVMFQLKVAAKSLINDIRCFVRDDIYLDILLISIIHFVLLMGRPICITCKRYIDV